MVVDGSNESLYYPDEELGLNLRTGTPLQKSFEKVDVCDESCIWRKSNKDCNLCTTKKYFDGWLNNFSTIPVSADNRDNVKTSS